MAQSTSRTFRENESLQLMNPSVASKARRKRLPLAVIAAGSLALGGAGGAAAIVPAFAAPESAVTVAQPAATVYPIYSNRAPEPVGPGQEMVLFDYAKSDPANGVVYLTDRTGAIPEGSEVEISASSVPNAGGVYEARLVDGQVVINGPEDSPDGYPTWNVDGSQISFAASYGPRGSSTFIGAAQFISDAAASLVADKVDKTSGQALLPVGQSSWAINLPPNADWAATADVTLSYFTGDDSAPNGGFVQLPLTDITVSNGKLTISDPELQQLTAGTGYFVSIDGATDAQHTSFFMGLYGELPEPTPTETAEPTPTETSEPTPTETAEPTPTETSEPTPTETAEPTPTETAEPTPTETSQPTPTETAEPTPTETAEPTPTETSEPTPTETEDPTPTETGEPEPTEVPEAEAPDSGDAVAPEDQELSYNEDSSDPSAGKYVYDVKDSVDDGAITVTYRTSPSAELSTVDAEIIDGQLVIQDSADFSASVQEHHQLLISIETADGQTISTVLTGANTLALVSEVSDDKLGLPLAEAGAAQWDFTVPSNFPSLTEGSYSFSVEYMDASGEPVALDDLEYTVADGVLSITDSRVTLATDGVYYLTGTPVEEANAAAAALEPAAAVEGSSSVWFGIYTPVVAPSPTDSDSPSQSPDEDPTPAPSTDPTSDAEDSPSPDESGSPEQTEDSQAPAPEADSQSPTPQNPDRLADTGASTGLIVSGVIALGLIVAGALALSIRRGRHS